MKRKATKKKSDKKPQKVRQICILVADREHFLVLCDEVKNAEGTHQVWYPPSGMYRFPPEEPARSGVIQEILGQIERKSGLVVRLEQLSQLPCRCPNNEIIAIHAGVKKCEVDFYWADKRELQGQSIKTSDSQWVPFEYGREIISGFLQPLSPELVAILDWYVKNSKIEGWN